MKRRNFEDLPARKTELTPEQKIKKQLYSDSVDFLTTRTTELLEYDETNNVCDRCGAETPKSTVKIDGQNLCLSEIKITYRQIGDNILIRFRYDPEIVKRVKQLDGAKFNVFATKNWIANATDENKNIIASWTDAFEV